MRGVRRNTARAMNPDLMLADEPTGKRESGMSFLLVTHNMDLARRCDRIIEVVDGRIRA